MFLHFKSTPACARTICAPTLLKYGNEMEKESSDIARTYDVALAAARIDTTDPEVTSDGFYMDLMMTRGSDPAEGKRARGADHLAVKEVKKSSQVAGRHAVIAFTEEEEDPRIVWCGHLGQGLGTQRCGLGGLSQRLYTQDGGLKLMSKTYDCDIMLCKCYVRQDCVNGGPSVRTRLSASLDIGSEPPSCRTHQLYYCISGPRPSSESVSSDAVNHPELRIR